MLVLQQHASHLFLFRIPHPHFVPKIRRASPRCVRLPHRLHPYANLLPQPLQVRQRQHSFHLDVIDLIQVRPILKHLRRQVAVIRQKHQPRCRILQISYRKHSLRQSSQKISQRLATFRVRHRRHHFRRLVQQNVHAPPVLRFDDSPCRLDPVFRGVRLRPKLPHHAPVHLHLSAEDQQLRMPPRSNPRPRNNLLQSLFHFLFLTFSSLVGARYIVPFFQVACIYFSPLILCARRAHYDLRQSLLAFSLHPYFTTSLLRLFTPPPSLPLAPRRSLPPACPHYSQPSVPAIPRALPSSRSRPPHFEDSPRSPPPLPPAQTPHRSPALPAPGPQTPSSLAAHPGRSTQTAAKTPSTFYRGSAVPSLPSAPPS